MSNNLKAVIFDASNTLFFGDGSEFEIAGLTSLFYYLWQQNTNLIDQGISEKALKLLWESIRKKPKGDAQHKQLSSTRDDLKQLFSKFDGLALDAVTLKQYEAVYYKGVVAATQALPDMQIVLEHLKQNYKLAVLSNTRSHFFIEESIRSAGLLNFFDVVITSEQVGWRKPHKTLFETTLDALSVEANQAVIVGDSLSKDIAGAKAIGMQTIWLSLNSSEAIEKTGVLPDFEAKHPQDIIEILNTISTQG